MAHRPPKTPMLTQNWHSFPQLHSANSTVGAAADMSNEEFSDFTAHRRGTHRRSISDNVAFFEASSSYAHSDKDQEDNPAMDALISDSIVNFEKLDDDQLMTMFADDASLSVLQTSSNVSTPSSDQNSNSEDKPVSAAANSTRQPTEVNSSCKQEQLESHCSQPSSSSNGEPITDPKRVKRILANRQSAQRSRVRKLQYISELERSVTTLQSEVSALSPRVAFLDHQRLILNVDNSALKQRIAALAQDKIFKDAHQAALKNEIERLRQVYQLQNIKNLNNHGTNNGSEMYNNVSSQPQLFVNEEMEQHHVMGC